MSVWRKLVWSSGFVLYVFAPQLQVDKHVCMFWVGTRLCVFKVQKLVCLEGKQVNLPYNQENLVDMGKKDTTHIYTGSRFVRGLIAQRKQLVKQEICAYLWSSRKVTTLEKTLLSLIHEETLALLLRIRTYPHMFIHVEQRSSATCETCIHTVGFPPFF